MNHNIVDFRIDQSVNQSSFELVWNRKCFILTIVQWSEVFFFAERGNLMRKIPLILGLCGQAFRRVHGFEQGKNPELVYNQSIYLWLFDDRPPVHPVYGVYNKHSPPMRKDDMTRYSDGMEIFEHSIDNFVNHHCNPYVSFLTSKFHNGTTQGSKSKHPLVII